MNRSSPHKKKNRESIRDKAKKRNNEFSYIRKQCSNRYTGACGKIIYNTHKIARSNSKKLMGSGHYKGGTGTLNEYYCEFCSGWHIGHSTSVSSRTLKKGLELVERNADS